MTNTANGMQWRAAIPGRQAVEAAYRPGPDEVVLRLPDSCEQAMSADVAKAAVAALAAAADCAPGDSRTPLLQRRVDGEGWQRVALHSAWD